MTFKLKYLENYSAHHSLLGSRRACSPPTPRHQDDGDHDDHNIDGDLDHDHGDDGPHYGHDDHDDGD